MSFYLLVLNFLRHRRLSSTWRLALTCVGWPNFELSLDKHHGVLHSWCWSFGHSLPPVVVQMELSFFFPLICQNEEKKQSLLITINEYIKLVQMWQYTKNIWWLHLRINESKMMFYNLYSQRSSCPWLPGVHLHHKVATTDYLTMTLTFTFCLIYTNKQ